MENTTQQEMSRALTLREVCRKYGVSRRAVQGYEKFGLAAPTGHTARGYLLYDEAAQQQIQRVKMYQDFGFSLREIAAMKKAPPEVRRQMLLERREALTVQLDKTQQAIRAITDLIGQL